ncbi:MAG: UDP-N-acetylmuramoyl-L-alanyl-D-glutamate--2,6-diaminopimelate ligase [Victivallales bacterium]|nr:UDP-N-acetylmuramoyl-L-alanyl-D-glutamate--2,6-diaminopimelate ligase [Victivallales bacterium]
MTVHDLIPLLEPWLDGVPAPVADLPLSGATWDSREVKPGMLFCAIRGAVNDGNRFIPNALTSGAIAVISDSDATVPESVPVLRIRPGTGYVVCGRIAEALAGYPARRLNLIGITGTCGKTTTAYILRDILRAAGLSVGMIGTVVYDMGKGIEYAADRTTPTPFQLQELFTEMVANGVTHVVMEISSAALDQGRLGTAHFVAVAFTNFSRDHLDYHGTMEDYYQAKRKLFTECLTTGAAAVINIDDETGLRLLKELAQGSPARLMPFKLKDAIPRFATSLPGRFNLYNANCAGLLAHSLDVKDEVIKQVLLTTKGAPGRLQRVECPNGVIAFVDYAHTPEEIAKALETLRPLCAGRLGIVFGCGGDRDRGKRPQMAVAAAEADELWLTSDNPRTEDPLAILADIRAGVPAGTVFHEEPDRRKAIQTAVWSLQPGDFLLVAGKGHEDYQEINHVKHPGSDFDILEELCHADR